MRRVGLLVLVAVGLSCNNSPPEFEAAARKLKLTDDGEPTTITFKATDNEGKVGKGSVEVTTTAGLLSETTAQLDEYGTGIVTFSCDRRLDPKCTGTVTISATWQGVSKSVAIKMIDRCPGETLCGTLCIPVNTDWYNCGACGNKCAVTQACINGSCQTCPPGDCDLDGWKVADGDCCDQYDQCTRPALVNAGAVEDPTNGVDDNCNGLLDAADTLDVASCDADAGPTTSDRLDFARALGLCRVADVDGGKTWGVVSVDLLLVNGDGGTPAPVNTATIRPIYGTLQPPEGSSLVVMSTDIATDSVQTNPALNAGKTNTTVSLNDCQGPGCLFDWFSASRPPGKQAFRLPGSPACGEPSSEHIANDSVMLRMKIRAPTNAKSFRLKTRFFSEEYPEYVCSKFNDQMVLLIDTPDAGVGNPIDKNLMTYASEDGGVWPVGINLAAGTPLFQSCMPQAQNAACWDKSVNPLSCGLGIGDLAQTQFGVGGSGCPVGGATRWMNTRGNVKPGEIFELRAAVWNVGDHQLSSLILLDDFEWAVEEVEPGTGEK